MVYRYLKKLLLIMFIMITNVLLFTGCGSQTSKIDDLCEAIEDGKTEKALEIASKIRNYDNSRTKGAFFLDVLSQGDYNTESPLVVACKIGDLKIIEYLLENDANPNYTPYGNLYPLEAYCSYGYEEGGIEGLELLLEYDAEPDYSLTQLTPLMDLSSSIKYASNNNYFIKLEMIDCLINNGANIKEDYITVMHCAATQQTRDFFDILWKYPKCRKLINAKTDNGETPLMYLARTSNLDMFKLFVENGANVYDIDNDGNTILDYAKENKNNEILNYLKTNYDF